MESNVHDSSDSREKGKKRWTIYAKNIDGDDVRKE